MEEAASGITQLLTSYWWVAMLVGALGIAVVLYVWKPSIVKSVEKFTTVNLPNTAADEITYKDKECAFMNLAIAASKQTLAAYEKEQHKKVVEGFTTQQKESHDETMAQHKALIKSYTQRQKQIGCEKYEGMMAEIINQGAQTKAA